MDNQTARTIVFYCNNFSMGGTETLILRLLEFYSNNDHRVILLTVTPINESIREDAKRVDFEHYIYDKVTRDFFSAGKKLCFEKTEQPLVITQFLPEFLKCYTVLRKSKFGVSFKHTLYIVHPHSTFFGPKKLTFLAKWMIIALLKKKVLVFMDEVCIDACVERYQLNRSLKFDVYRLPLFINETAKIEKKNSSFNILTITRFEFPFKGYVLGLIDSFSQICSKYPSTSLTIIGHGSGRTEVTDLIFTLPSDVSSRISILGEVPYHKINDYIARCDVYVGMGTTVLDAANNNKVVITAVAYQKSNLAVGFFHEEYKSVGEILQNNKKYPIFTDLLEEIINTTEFEFEMLIKKSKEVLRKHYNINLIGQQLVNHTDRYLSNLESLLINTFAYIHLYSVKVVQWIKVK